MKKNNGIKNELTLYLFSVLLGTTAGAVVWLFLKAVAVSTELLWVKLPELNGGVVLPVMICAAGGLLAGLMRLKFGDYPEEMETVMKKIKTEKHYGHSHMAVMLISAFIPLAAGASVGPEAGLVGIIAALCYWVGDNMKYAKNHKDEYSAVGTAVTLGVLFHSPLFGIFSIIEDPDGDKPGSELPRSSKLLLYGLSAGAGILVYSGLDKLFGAAMSGFPSFEKTAITNADRLLAVLYAAIGFGLYLLYELFEKLTKRVAKLLPAVIREVICGLLLGLTGMAVPLILFSGEEQMEELMGSFGKYLPVYLMLVCLLKLLMTPMCINFGMKGGHFFPVIFACVCMGFGVTLLIFGNSLSHAAFACAVITASMLGAQLKKPVAAAMLLLLCFPVRLLFWTFLPAALSARIVQAVAPKEAAQET